VPVAVAVSRQVLLVQHQLWKYGLSAMHEAQVGGVGGGVGKGVNGGVGEGVPVPGAGRLKQSTSSLSTLAHTRSPVPGPLLGRRHEVR